jgi:hypothetical protein
MRKTKSAIFEAVHGTTKGLHAPWRDGAGYAAQIRPSVSTAEVVLRMVLDRY